MQSELYGEMPFDDILKCVHCGLCLDACPTYRVLGLESDSPRGRLYVMRGLWEGALPATAEVIAPLDRCLDCRACETACPSAVPYGELLEKTRGVLNQKARRLPLLTRFFLRRVLASNGWLVFLSRIGWLSAALRLPRLAALFHEFLPSFLVRGAELMPGFAGKSFKQGWRAAPAESGRRKVGLFTGCIMDVADHDIHRASVLLVERAGYQVVLPKDQTCCGALAVHGGEREVPRALARRNAAAFGPELEAIVVNAAGCGAQLKEYGPLFSETGTALASWHRFGDRVVDILSFLAAAESLPNWHNEPEVVLYDAPCHLMHAQRDDAAPRRFLANLPGVRLVPLREADSCCGAAGIYNLTQGPLADRVLARKLDDVAETYGAHPGATCLLTANPGCLYQLRMGCRRRGLALEVVHPVVWLARRLAP